tara:strand:- start:1485 stop:1670 length:186 start_codon:yes stop_codon:yes gene_type:complete
MEMKHVGGSADVPWYWDQKPINMNSVSHCPGCGEQLPLKLEQHRQAMSDGTLRRTKEEAQV